MGSGDYTYLWQAENWTHWRYDLPTLVGPLAEVSQAQGMLAGRLADLGLGLRGQASLAALTDDVLRTSQIEGEHLDVGSVRSSVARRLGVEIGGLAPADRQVDGVVEMMLDATLHCADPVTRERLFGWHAGLFADGYSGIRRIRVGGWRDDAGGPMQVVSGAIGHERVHYQAPPADRLEGEIERFLGWVEGGSADPPLLKAGLGHLWLVTLHPFDDGNGRIARALGDLLLARADRSPQRFYSVSAQIQRERKAYYEILERTQKGRGEVTEWLLWFLETVRGAVAHGHISLDALLARTRIWRAVAEAPLNGRQRQLISRLLDGFEGKLTSGKWALFAKCSQDTALRDITELLERGLLRRSSAGGRSTSYELANL